MLQGDKIKQLALKNRNSKVFSGDFKFVALPSTHSDNKFISQQDVEKGKKRKYVTVAELYFSNTLEL